MWRRVSAVVALLLALVACGDGATVDGDLTVFAATSLTGPFTDIGEAFEDAHPGTRVTFNFAASSALVLQIQEAIPADVIALADTRTMRLVGTASTVFARNRLVIATRPGNPTHVTRLADLASAGTVSLCATEVPCGAYAAEALRKAGVTLDEAHVTRGPNAAATLSAVTDGDAAAAIVYVTDAKAAGARVQAITIPRADNVIAAYPITALPEIDNARAATAFVDFVRGRAGQRILRRYGFDAP
jgi:molybdate transport system substrate-binding protein